MNDQSQLKLPLLDLIRIQNRQVILPPDRTNHKITNNAHLYTASIPKIKIYQSKSPVLDANRYKKKRSQELRRSKHAELLRAYAPFDKQYRLTFTLGQGNNCELIRRVMESRGQWHEVAQNTGMVHFRWAQSYFGVNYDRMTGENGIFKEVVNHFEFHKQLTTKTGLLKNLKKHCYLNLLNPFTYTPVAFILDLDKNDLSQFVNYYVNQAPPNFPITKTHLTIKQNQKRVLSLQKEHVKTPNLSDTFVSAKSYLWLLKPPDMNRGNGVHVFNSLEELEKLINQFNIGFNQSYDAQSKGMFLRCRQFVIQKYIEKPLLINQRKFDVRIWVLLTHNMDLFMFKDGYLRTSSEVFTLDHQNPFVHLTNNAVQKFSKNYGQFESGNQLSFKALQEYFGDLCDFQNVIIPQIKDIIRISFQSVRHKIDKHRRKYCFEIFGYDFILDAKFKPWLIEVNTNPCLEESSPLLHSLIPKMIDDAFKLTIDHIFQSNQKETSNNQGWELLINLI